jgi:hypothetical protein
LTRFGEAVKAFAERSAHAEDAPSHPPEFRRQMVDLVRAGRDPEGLAKECKLIAQSIRNWVAVA